MSEGDRIRIVGRNDTNRSLVADLLSEAGYETVTSATLDADAVADATSLVLVDADGFGENVWAACERLRERGIPFLVLSIEPMLVESGTQDGDTVLEKPIEKQRLLRAIGNALGDV